MPLPLNINDLLTGQVVEWDRLEFKEDWNPLEAVQAITPDEVTVLSFPGPDRSINMDDLRAGRAVARRYRNRRIGEFLKELDLTEGRSTGIPKILEAMANNGSETPSFETDPDRTSFLVRLPVRPAPEEAGTKSAPRRHQEGTKSEIEEEEAQDEAQDEAHDGTKSGPSRDQVEILRICLNDNSLKGLLSHFKRTNRSKFRDQVIRPLLDAKYLEMTRPETPTSRLQKYRTTEKGKRLLEND